jgi:serine/threonine-protein kinase
MGVATVLAGRYRLESLVAAGGVGEVWRGRDEVLGRAVAVKLLRAEYASHPEILGRFRAEARHAAALAHPGVAQVYDYGEDGRPYLVMELVEGPSLDQVLAGGPLPVARAVDVVAQAAAGLAAAHAAGLVHRDIKPANLLLGPGGAVKVTDFGIAHAAGSAPVTRTGMLVGTPAYLAPERAAGKPATAASDLYSLGIVCYECLTGAPPFTGTALEVALAHQHRPLPPLPPSAPADVAALVTRLTAKDPEQRPASATEAAGQAGRLRDDLTTTAAAATPAPTLPLAQATTRALTLAETPGASWSPSGQWAGHRPPPSGRARRKPAWALAAAAVAAAAILAGWLLAGHGGPAHPAARQATPTPVRSSPAPPRLTHVSPAALAGQPLPAVRRQLRRQGLHVRVAWQPNGHQQPGTVLTVQPTGQLRSGTTVLVTAALPAPGHHHHGHHHHGNGDGQGDESGD